MFQSSKVIAPKGLAVLRKDLDIYLQNNRFIYAKSFKRKVFLDKLPDALIRRKKTMKKRLQCFVVACDIVRHTAEYEERVNTKKQKEFSLTGISACGRKVSIHLREEFSGKDRRLFFVSCFFEEK